MTGSGAGAIDFDWLLDNLDVAEIPIGSDDDEIAERLTTFCLRRKALQAAESFVLARYHLFEQVYLHKTTRGMETIVSRILHHVAEAAGAGDPKRIGLDADDPLVTFFGPDGGTLEHYLALDDTAVWAAASRLARSAHEGAAGCARRLLNRERLHCLDLESRLPRQDGEPLSEAEARWRRQADHIDAATKGDETVVKDMVKFSAYGEIGADQTRTHNRLAILVDQGPPREITTLSDLVRALPRREIIRYYFDTSESRTRAMGRI